MILRMKRYIPWKNLTKIALVICLIAPVLYFTYHHLTRSDLKTIKLPFKRRSNNSTVRKNYQISLKPLYDQKAIALQKIRSSQGGNDEVIRFGRCRGEMTLAIVVCGDRRPMTLVALKSAVALSLKTVHLAVMADDDNRQHIAEELLDWPSSILQRISFEIHPITFPDSKMASEWKKLFKLCAAQRLFLPKKAINSFKSVLRDIDSLIYIDTDIVFLQSMDHLWNYFSKMNSSQMSALSPEHEDYSTGWYNRFARHPYYKPLGVNSGVMLMNLTRMRKFQWESYLEPIFHEYKLKIVWGDQDIVNILFHYHPDKLLIFGCEWNYRPDHCMYSRICKTADVRGISVLHGNRGVFTNGKQPSFRAVYNSFESYELGSDLERHLLLPLKSSLKSTVKTNCGSNSMAFLRKLQESVLKLKNHQYPSTCTSSINIFNPL